MNRVCVIDVPGLSRDLLAFIPPTSALGKWIATQRVIGLTPTWPAVTCSVQATLTTGQPPSSHGIVSNGMATYRSADDQALIDSSSFASYREDVSFWEQSNQLLDVSRFWQDASGNSRFKTALICMQQSMPGFAGTLRPAADIVLTPKPDHGPDGKIVSLCWSEPRALVGQLFEQLGPFPLMNYWGPMAGIASSRWIAKAAALVWQTHQPTLQIVYVPHLDYDLQRFGPNSTQAQQAVSDVAAALEPLLNIVLGDGGKIVVLSEYAIQAVDRAIQPNRLLADAGLLLTRRSDDGAIIDYEKTPAFVMVDHQIGHLFGRDGASIAVARRVLESAGLEILDGESNLTHRRAGDLLLQAPAGAWLDYRWWSKPEDAPVFARLVDIHRKPGYDPLELFWDRSTNGVAQDSALVRGSHGRVHGAEAVCIGPPGTLPSTDINAVEVAALLQRLLG